MKESPRSEEVAKCSLCVPSLALVPSTASLRPAGASPRPLLGQVRC